MPGRSRLERVFAIASVATNRDAQTRELINMRCDRGAQIAKKIGFSESTTTAIYSLDEHWNGKGFPAGRKAQDIPLFSRIMNLCQTLEVFVTLNGVSDGFQVLRDRSGSWFDPELVRAMTELEKDTELWKLIEQDRVREAVIEMEPINVSLYADEAKLDNVCEAFANVIDIKSPYTHSHSRGVTSIAVAICQTIGATRRSGDAGATRRSAARHRKTQRTQQYSRQTRQINRRGMGDGAAASVLHAADTGAHTRLSGPGVPGELASRTVGRFRIFPQSTRHADFNGCSSYCSRGCLRCAVFETTLPWRFNERRSIQDHGCGCAARVG